MQKTPSDQIERVARLYKRNADAAAALGIATRSFARLCRELGIETPYSRARRRRRSPQA
jgi:hypothetical protein